MYQMVHMINAHKAYDQLDRVQNYVFNLQSGDFRDGVLFHLTSFKRKLRITHECALCMRLCGGNTLFISDVS